MKKTIPLLVGLLLVLPAEAATLGEMLIQAWSRHPQANALPGREAAAAARGEQAAALLPGPPSVALSNVNDRMNRDAGRDEWELEMAVPLWLPGQRSAHAAEADSAAAGVAAQRVTLRLQLAGELREAWWDVAAARAGAALAAQRLKSALALESDVQRRFKVGEVSRIDANLARAERLAADAEAGDAASQLQAAEQRFSTLAGAPAPAELTAEDERDRSTLMRHERLAAVDDDPRLRAVAATAQAARDRLRVAEATRREAPELAVLVKRERGTFDEPYASAVGVKLTIPFSSGPRYREGNASAQADAAEAASEVPLLRQRLELERTRAAQALTTGERLLAMAEERRRLAGDNLQLAEKAFAVGEFDLPSLLRTRAAAFEAEAVFAKQSIARAAAWSRLKQAMGVLP